MLRTSVLISFTFIGLLAACNVQPAAPDSTQDGARVTSPERRDPAQNLPDFLVREYRGDDLTPQAEAALTRARDAVEGSTGEKDGPLAKVGFDLALLHYEAQAPSLETHRLGTPTERIAVDATALEDGEVLLEDLERLGLEDGAAYGRVASGHLPVSAIADAAELGELLSMRPAISSTNVGAVTSQGDRAIASDEVREQGFTGAGVKVGIISDSFDRLKDPECVVDPAQGTPPGTVTSYADDIESGDLPEGVALLDDTKACDPDEPGDVADEGRALAQIVYDVAPEVEFAFHTDGGTQASFAQAIVDLTEAGADIIVDDVSQLFAPFFQDGVVAQAIGETVALGVPYFSAAGNNATNSYESPFRDSGETGEFGGALHDFDPGPGVDTTQGFTLEPDDAFALTLQWDDPAASASPESPGANSDVDMYFIFPDGTIDGDFAAIGPNIGADPNEFLGIINTADEARDFELVIALREGPEPDLLKYIASEIPSSRPEYTNGTPTVVGNSNAPGIVSVGAAFYQDTPAFGQSPPLREIFSAVGGVPILFDVEGNRLAEPEVRQQPLLVAPDDVNTTFFFDDIPDDDDSFPNFFGTSAAAPHAAGVAALLLSAEPDLTPEEISELLTNTAVDMAEPGFDFETGFGLVQADAALAQLLETNRVSDVRPVLECVERQGEGYLARFGYLNEEGRAVDIPVAGDNTFTPSPADRGQPTTFEAGRQRNVFEVAFGGDELVWTLGQRTATASANPAQRCE